MIVQFYIVPIPTALLFVGYVGKVIFPRSHVAAGFS